MPILSHSIVKGSGRSERIFSNLFQFPSSPAYPTNESDESVQYAHRPVLFEAQEQDQNKKKKCQRDQSQYWRQESHVLLTLKKQESCSNKQSYDIKAHDDQSLGNYGCCGFSCASTLRFVDKIDFCDFSADRFCWNDCVNEDAYPNKKNGFQPRDLYRQKFKQRMPGKSKEERIQQS